MSKSLRLIGRLDIKGPNLIKGIHLEGLRVLGRPNDFATKYYNEGIDELIYMDAVASLYERNSLLEIVKNVANRVFIPLTVGGGIRSIADVDNLLRVGADKVAVNTAAIRNPKLITEISQEFGAQCMVLSIDAKRNEAGWWEVYTHGGRERTNIDAIEWAKAGVELGAGEILLTSIDREGTKKGFDISLVSAMTRSVPIPVIASGGMGCLEHAIDLAKESNVDGIAMANVLHYKSCTIQNIRKGMIESSINVREYYDA